MTGDAKSLTLDEARERAALLQVSRYDIDVDWRDLLEGSTSRTVSTITFTCREPGSETFVDAVGEIVSASLNGAPLDVSGAAGGRLPLRDLAAENVLVVELAQAETGSSQGILRTVDPSDGLVYVWTSFEPDDARRVFACFDQPDLKAPHRFTVHAPESWTVTSNGAPESVSEPADGARTWTFPDTPPLSTYVVVVDAGPLHEIRSRRGGHDLGLYSRQSMRAYLERDAEELFTLTEQGLAFFAERFDQPFPQERYDQVFMPNMGGAMENWGCVTYGDSMLTTSPPTAGERLDAATVLLHEMAHMWFGDLVTMRWWDDLWLNEAFASFASTWAAASATRHTDAWAEFQAVWKQWGYDDDASPASHPIRGDVGSVDSAMANFDGITYAKGQAVLAQLMHLVGEDAFSAGLAAYFRQHAWGNTVLGDLTDALGASAGRDLTAWTSGWLDAAGTDTVHVVDGAVLLEGPAGPTPRRHRLDVGSYAVEGDDLRPVGTTSLETDGERTPVDLPDADLHLPNDGDLSFVHVRLDPASLRTAIDHGARLPSPVSRAVVAGLLRRMVLEGDAPASDALEGVLGLLASESSDALVPALIQSALELAGDYVPTEGLAAAEERVADTVRPLTAHPEHAVDARRALARTTRLEPDLARLAEEAGDDLRLAWGVEARKARLGRYDEAAVAALEARDPDPEAWLSALAARAAQPTEEGKHEAWQKLYVERAVPADRIGVLKRTFWLPEQADLLRPWCDHYLEALPGLSGGGMLNVFGLAGAMFPTVGDEEFLARADAMAADPATHPVLRQALLAGGDLLRRMLRARAA